MMYLWMKEGIRLMAAGLVLCAGLPSLTAEENRAPVVVPADGNGPPPAEVGGGRGNDDWKMMPAWYNGSNLSQVGYLVTPAGITADISGRVMNVALVRNGRFLVAKTDRSLVVLDAKSLKVLAQHEFPIKGDGGTMYGLAVGADDATVYGTTKKSQLTVATVDAVGVLTFGASIDLATDKKGSDPLGIALSPDGRRAFVALAVSNSVAVVDLQTGKVSSTVPVGVCPYAVTLAADGKFLFVSNFGGRHAAAGDHTELSAGTPVPVDDRSVALRGTVSVIDTATGKVVEDIQTRIHPEAMVLSPDGKSMFVVDAGGDGVSEIDVTTRKVVREHNTKPRADLPFGSLSTGIAVSADGKRLFTANAGNNAVAVLDLAGDGTAPIGFIPAGGYPGSVCVAGSTVFIGNVLGLKSDLQRVDIPDAPAELQAMTAVAEKSYHLHDILRTAARADGLAPVPLRPVPERLGEPSPIRHVVYIIKENKKFDQVLGDIGRGNCEPKLVEFPRATTPNIHALADEFVLLDNYYCNGVLSCDGHQHATQGLTTPIREKDWANLHLTYSFGIDPLCYAGCGFIWDQVLRAGLSFQNFGELDESVIPKGRSWTDFYTAWKNGEPAQFTCNYRIETLRRYSDPKFPGWAMAIPDQVRADAFIAALGRYEKEGKMPNFITIYLPNDHAQGGSRNNPTPRAYVADNDLATGRVVEALSKSSFWKEMTVFINEDDPQTGTDHVDGHRSYCLLAGPFVKRGGPVISNFYNQSSVLHTISRILGLPPLNQTVAAAPLMTDCFQERADLASYACRPAQVPLDELNPDPAKAPSKKQGALAPRTEKLDFSAPDRIDKDAILLSRWTWATVRGDERFPIEYAGAHGKGLKALGLQLADDDDDD